MRSNLTFFVCISILAANSLSAEEIQSSGSQQKSTLQNNWSTQGGATLERGKAVDISVHYGFPSYFLPA